MGLTQTTTPSFEPITVTQAKLFLRIDNMTDEDTLIASMITAARERVESSTQCQLGSASYVFTTSVLNGSELLLPKPPIIAVQSVNTVDSSGNVGTVSTSDYIVTIDDYPGKITFINTPSYDDTRPDGLRVTFTAGYTSSAAIPADLVLAMYWIVATAYSNREETETPNNTVIGRESSIDRLLNRHRAYRVGV